MSCDERAERADDADEIELLCQEHQANWNYPAAQREVREELGKYVREAEERACNARCATAEHIWKLRRDRIAHAIRLLGRDERRMQW